jgi:hypothetical protein
MNYSYFQEVIESELERVTNHIVNHYQQDETYIRANIDGKLVLETRAKWKWRKDHDIGMVEVEIKSCITRINIGDQYFDIDTTSELHYSVINEEIEL